MSTVCVRAVAAFTLLYFGLELEAAGNGTPGESLESSAPATPGAGRPRAMPEASRGAPPAHFGGTPKVLLLHCD